MTCESDLTFDDALKAPADVLDVELDLYLLCANQWRANEDYAAAEYVLPNPPTGYAYQSAGGRSGRAEPRWPTTLAATVQDGSVTWTCVAAGSNGLSVPSAPTASSDLAAFTITAVSIAESRKILATYNGGTLGTDPVATFTFTLNGKTRVASQTVKIRAR